MNNEKILNYDWPNQKEDNWKYIKLNTNIDFNRIKYDKIFLNNILLKDFKKHKKELDKIKNKINFQINDKIDYLNSQNNIGFFLNAKKETFYEIKIISQENCFSNLKSAIILDKNSEIKIKQYNKILSDVFRIETLNIYLKENSKMDYYFFSEIEKNTQNITTINAFLSENSTFKIYTAQKNGQLNRIKINIYHNTGKSNSKIYSCFSGEKNNVIDITTITNHNSLNTKSDILVKGVLKDNSTSVYRGKIKITNKGQKTESFLSDHTLLLGKESMSYSIPSLEIDANDVKASHSASSGKIEQEILFYLMSRGLNIKKAEKILTTGFLFDIFNKVTESKIKQEVIDFFEI